MIRKIERTSTIAWSPPNLDEPLLAMGSVAGALDPSFSSNAKLEIFGLGLNEQTKSLKLLGSTTSNARQILFIDSTVLAGESR